MLQSRLRGLSLLQTQSRPEGQPSGTHKECLTGKLLHGLLRVCLYIKSFEVEIDHFESTRESVRGIRRQLLITVRPSAAVGTLQVQGSPCF